MPDCRQLVEAYLLPLGLRVALAALVFLLGRAVARLLVRGLDRMMERARLDLSLRTFLRDVAYAILVVAVAVAALDLAGIETTAVIAVLGAAGLAIGLALQGSLSNLAAGVMLIVLRPYRVADLVVLGKYLGRVDAIKIFHTTLITADHREVIIPNGQILAAPIENLTALGQRRIELTVTVTGESADLARVQAMLGALALDPRAARPLIELVSIGDTGATLHVRPWTTAEAYAAVAADTMERIREALAATGLAFHVTLAPAGTAAAAG